MVIRRVEGVNLLLGGELGRIVRVMQIVTFLYLKTTVLTAFEVSLGEPQGMKDLGN
jgi:hypothetical protein